MIVCKYLKKCNNKIYYEILASDTFCNFFCQGQGVSETHIFPKLKKILFCPFFLNNIQLNFFRIFLKLFL